MYARNYETPIHRRIELICCVHSMIEGIIAKEHCKLWLFRYIFYPTSLVYEGGEELGSQVETLG